MHIISNNWSGQKTDALKFIQTWQKHLQSGDVASSGIRDITVAFDGGIVTLGIEVGGVNSSAAA